MDVENENAKNIHPVKINPLKIEGALKLIITKYGSKIRAIISKKKIFSLILLAISEALAEAKAKSRCRVYS